MDLTIALPEGVTARMLDVAILPGRVTVRTKDVGVTLQVPRGGRGRGRGGGRGGGARATRGSLGRRRRCPAVAVNRAGPGAGAHPCRPTHAPRSRPPPAQDLELFAAVRPDDSSWSCMDGKLLIQARRPRPAYPILS
jgi:hypothetical protein